MRLLRIANNPPGMYASGMDYLMAQEKYAKTPRDVFVLKFAKEFYQNGGHAQGMSALFAIKPEFKEMWNSWKEGKGVPAIRRMRKEIDQKVSFARAFDHHGAH